MTTSTGLTLSPLQSALRELSGAGDIARTLAGSPAIDGATRDFAAEFLGALDRFTQVLQEARETLSGVGAGTPNAPSPQDAAGPAAPTGLSPADLEADRRDMLLQILGDGSLTGSQQVQLLRERGFTTDEVDRHAGWVSGTASAHLRTLEGVTHAGEVLAGVKAGRWSLEEGVALLQGIGGSPQERLRFAGEASDYFAQRALGPEQAERLSNHPGYSTLGIWDALVRGDITAEDAIQSAQARVSKVVINLPGFGASPSGSGVLKDFSRAELLANMDLASARSINSKLWMQTHDGVPPKLGPAQLREFMADYNAPVSEELRFLLDLPAAAGVGRGLGYRDPTAASPASAAYAATAAASGTLLGIS